MEHDKPVLNEKTIYSAVTGMEYVKMLIPEGWNSSIDRYEDYYAGKIFPYTFRVVNASPDKSCGIIYLSPETYTEDLMCLYTEGEIDKDGILHGEAVSVEEYLDRMVKDRYGNEEDFAFVEYIPDPGNDKRCREWYEKTVTEEEKKGNYLNSYYNELGTAIYRYKLNGTVRYHVATVFIEIKDIVRWDKIPDASMYTEEELKKHYPDYRYDKDNDRYIYPSLHQYESYVDQCLEMDCPEEDYEFIYKEIYVPVINKGVSICKDVFDDFKRIVNAPKAKETEPAEKETNPEEQREVEAILAQMKRDHEQADAQMYDYMRKTNDEIYNINQSAYRHTQNTFDRMNEGWSDTFRGDGRFIDSHGREHIIHTDNKYAFKRGNTYITSDNPLDRLYGFEELKKKKY